MTSPVEQEATAWRLAFIEDSGVTELCALLHPRWLHQNASAQLVTQREAQCSVQDADNKV